jgi:RHS repeat-associated protein
MLASNAYNSGGGAGGRAAYRTISGYQAEVVSVSDYGPYGNVLTGRNFSLANDTAFHYGFNGKYKDNDIEGKDNALDFGAREDDPRRGQMWTIDPLFKNYAGWSPYAFVLDNPLKLIDPTGMGALDNIYLDHSGKEIHRDIKPGPNKTFVVKTTETQSTLYTQQEIEKKQAAPVDGISKAAQTRTEKEIKAGNIDNNPDIQKNTVPIQNQTTLCDMYSVTIPDDGTGGTSPDNNREYGGTVSPIGVVTPVPPGDVANPKFDAHAQVDIPTGSDQFHSHPSGDIEETIGSTTPVINEGNTTFNFSSPTVTTSSFIQPPSPVDVNLIGASTGYVFGKRDGNTYVYTSSGIVAVFPTANAIKNIY